jgi:general secretion pathway protein L
MNIYGIDIGVASVKIAQVEKKLRGYSVKRLKAFPTGGDPSGALRDALAQMGFDPREDTVAAVFPKDGVSTRLLKMPLGDDKKIAEALPFELEAVVPFDAEQMVIAHQLTRTKNGETQVGVAFAPKHAFARFLSIFGAAGADPDYVIPESFAIPAALGGVNRAPAVTVDIGRSSVLILATRGGSLVLAHTADVGVDTFAGASATTDTKGETQAPLSIFADGLARQVKLVMTSASEQGDPFSPPKVSLCGGLAADAKLQSLLAARLGVPVERADAEGDDAPCDIDGLRDRWGRPPIFVSALGAALIAVKDPDTRANFRTGSEKKSGGFSGARRQAILTAALAAVFVFAWIGAYIAEGMGLDGKYGALKNELRAEFKKAMPEVTNIVSEAAQLKSALTALGSRATALGPALAEKDPFLDRFASVTDSIPEGARLDITEFTYEWDRILLSGKTDSFEKVEQFRNNLEKLEWAGKAVVEGAKTGIAGGGVEFKMTLGAAR